MKSIQATEAKAHLAELLRAVEHGESFSITRHGRPIAYLLPTAVADEQVRREALRRFRERQRGWRTISFSAEEILDMRHEGHRA